MGAALLGLLVAAGCPARPSGAPGPETAPGSLPGAEEGTSRTPLTDVENELRAAFAAGRPVPSTPGPDPVALASLGEGRAAVALRAGSALQVVGPGGVVGPPRGTLATPREVVRAGELLVVVSAQDPRFALHRLGPDGPGPAQLRPLPALAPRGLQARVQGEQTFLHLVDEATDELLTFELAGTEPRLRQRLPTGRRPIATAVAGRFVAVASLLDHRLEVFASDAQGQLRSLGHVEHDAPLVGLALREVGDDVLVAAGGVEDHPLDRSEGFFGWIDSFLFVYRASLSPRSGASALERLAALDVSELGVVTPTALAFSGPDGAATLSVWGAGSTTWLQLGPFDFAARSVGSALPVAARLPAPPGVRAVAPAGEGAWLATGPLTDEVWRLSPDAAPSPLLRAPAASPEEREVRLGEALATTDLMAERPSAEGKKSRFSCETCHFEGTVDGRTHFTGRGDVHATTKPLFGLVQNRPHFTRALDKTTRAMVRAEFRVVARGTEGDDEFDLAAATTPALLALGYGPGEVIGPTRQREAFLRYLAALAPPRSPWAEAGEGRFTPEQARGAELFRDRCASCHAARRLADDPTTEVPFTGWPEALFGPGLPPVWGRDGYEKVGVEPYVHDDGARPSTLRGLWLRGPFFTNGSAKTLDDVLGRFRVDEGRAWHDHPTGTGLTAEEKQGLLAFLRLL